MNPREFKMVLGILGGILFGAGAAAGYVLVYSPLDEAMEARQKLEDEINGTPDQPDKPGLEHQVDDMRKAMPLVQVAKRESLPPDLDDAKYQYTHLLERLLQQANIPTTSITIPEARNLDARAPMTPEISKKPAYKRMQFKIELVKVNIWQISDFLEAFYRLGLLHQITDLEIARTNKVGETRSGLKATITIEAITLYDVAEKRTALFPVVAGGKLTPAGELLAALGGGQAVETVAAAPEVARRIIAQTSSPVLAARGRNYSYLAVNDIFYGVLIPPKIPPGITVEKPKEVAVKPGQKIPDVKVVVTGDGSDEAQLTAKVVKPGTMLPEGPLEVDAKTRTIHFPAPTDVSGHLYSFVEVKATARDGRSHKTSFKVAYAGDDISAAIRLVNVSDSDGTGTAQILDMASPHKYNITAAPKKEVEVLKYRPKGRTMKDWELDPRYKQPPGVLALTDDTSSTRRFFRIVAIEGNSVIVQELDKPDAKLDPSGALFRWVAGKSLKEFKEKDVKVKPDEAKRIMSGLAQAAVKESPVSAATK